ncbi:MAG: alpha/beta hydrolase, partial [Streptomyces oryziradicis]|nr:alpha/beta hydrolase [Actinacidiphila oryziradicis]
MLGLSSPPSMRREIRMPASCVLGPRSRVRRGYALAAALTSLASVAAPAAADGGSGRTGGPAGPRPTVVAVHGAFADASSWNAVVERLQRAGYPVVAPANPLRGLAQDSTYISSVLKSIQGPIVLVGHSYGGAVISSAANGNRQVKALVFIDALMPDKGEVLSELAAKFRGSELSSALKSVPFRNADGTMGADLYLQPDKLRRVFAADLPAAMTQQMAVSQRPIAASAFAGRAAAAAWRAIPSWALVGTKDKAIAPDVERFEAKRAGSHTIEVSSSHVAMISHPDAVTDLILAAAAAKSAPAKPALAATGSRTLVLMELGTVAGAAVLAGAGLV